MIYNGTLVIMSTVPFIVQSKEVKEKRKDIVTYLDRSRTKLYCKQTTRLVNNDCKFFSLFRVNNKTSI